LPRTDVNSSSNEMGTERGGFPRPGEWRGRASLSRRGAIACLLIPLLKARAGRRKERCVAWDAVSCLKVGELTISLTVFWLYTNDDETLAAGDIQGLR
jgi:hypothetical protein